VDEEDVVWVEKPLDDVKDDEKAAVVLMELLMLGGWRSRMVDGKRLKLYNISGFEDSWCKVY